MDITLWIGLCCLIAICILTRSKGNVDRCESYIEKRLVRALLSSGYDVRTQVKCGPYRVDIVIGNIAIECDGIAFHSSPAQKKYDKKRTSYLYRHGYSSVLRFSGAEINNNPYDCVRKIDKKIGEWGIKRVHLS